MLYADPDLNNEKVRVVSRCEIFRTQRPTKKPLNFSNYSKQKYDILTLGQLDPRYTTYSSQEPYYGRDMPDWTKSLYKQKKRPHGIDIMIRNAKNVKKMSVLNHGMREVDEIDRLSRTSVWSTPHHPNVRASRLPSDSKRLNRLKELLDPLKRGMEKEELLDSPIGKLAATQQVRTARPVAHMIVPKPPQREEDSAGIMFRRKATHNEYQGEKEDAVSIADSMKRRSLSSYCKSRGGRSTSTHRNYTHINPPSKSVLNRSIYSNMNKFNEQSEEEKMSIRTVNLLKYLSTMKNSKIATHYLNKLLSKEIIEDAFSKLNEQEELEKKEREEKEKSLTLALKLPELLKESNIAPELLATQDTAQLDTQE